MELKVGDKLYCTKSIDGNRIYTKDTCYEIIAVDNNGNPCLKSNNKTKNWFSIYEGSWFYVWNYFCTEKELRKLKLKEIENE